METQSVVTAAVNELARRVAAGEYAPGDLMPSVRQVAAEFEMNRATAQLVLNRLEQAGFVDAKWGKGFTIRDVRAQGGVDVYRKLFGLSMQLPEHAVSTMRDMIDVERAIVMQTLLACTQEDHPVDLPSMERDVDALEEIARSAEPDLREFLRRELSLLRDLVGAVGHTMHRAMLNTIGEMVLDVPQAVEAFFVVAPDVHVLVWRAIHRIWSRGGEPLESELALFHDLFTMYHDNVIVRFEELAGVEARPAAAEVEVAELADRKHA